jgi:hypothetical protein
MKPSAQEKLISDLTIRGHRIYLGHKLLDPITKKDREELVTLIQSIASRIAVWFPGDEQ